MQYSKWTLGAILSISLTGCALVLGIDLEDVVAGTGDAGGGGLDECEEVNGCSRADASPDLSSREPTVLPVTIKDSEIENRCSIVDADNEIEFAFPADCTLVGGIVQNTGVEEPDLTSPLTDAGASHVVIKELADRCSLPYFCAADPLNRRGVIFYNK